MTAKELRIGNWVSFENVFYKIHSIAEVFPTLDTEEFGIGVVDYNNIHPIPLTEEILLKCPQFKVEYYDEGSEDEGKYYSLNLFPDDKYNDLALISGDKNGKFDVYLFPYENVRFEYLHQLQNFVGSLGKELEVSLT